jgi:hypothetical protein
MSSLFSLKYWFKVSPGPLLPTAQQALIFFVVGLIALTIFTAIVKGRAKKTLYGRMWQTIYGFLLGNAIIGVLVLFFMYELVPFLSSRFWFLVWFLVMFGWFGFIVWKFIQIPKRKKELEKEREYKKYIP